MSYEIRNVPLLKKILWADCLLGGSTALIGLLGYNTLAGFLGLSAKHIIMIAAITGVYALMALGLSLRQRPSARPLRVLVYANWIWSVISIGLLLLLMSPATVFGIAFLVLQVLVVGLLAYLEGRHIYRIQDSR